MRFALFCLAASLAAVCAGIESTRRLPRPLRERTVNWAIWQDDPNNVFDDEVQIHDHFFPSPSTNAPPTTKPPPPSTTTQPPPPPSTTTQPPPPPSTTTQPPPPPSTTPQPPPPPPPPSTTTKPPPPPSTTTKPPPPPPPSTTTQPPPPSTTIGTNIIYPTSPSWPNYPLPNYPPPNYPPANYPQPNYPQPNYPLPNYPQPNYPTTNYPQPTTTADPMCPEGPSRECRELPLGQRGSIQVRNEGGVPLQFFIEYKVRGRKILDESGLFTYTYKRIKEIPADAVDIVLTVQGVWGVTSDILKKQWKYPVIRCYSSNDGQRVTKVGCS